MDDYRVFDSVTREFISLSEMRRLVQEDLARFRASDEASAKARAKEMEEAFKAAQAAKAALKRARWKAHWKLQFDQWQRRNEEASDDAGRERRAQARKDLDLALVNRILTRARVKRKRVDTEAQLALLSDHEFIELKFKIAERPSPRWLAPL